MKALGLNFFTISGRRPSGSYMPRFRNIHKQETDFLRGYSAFVNSSREEIATENGFGIKLLKQLDNPQYGYWKIFSQMMGETIPKKDNKVWLDATKKDMYGLPQLHISVEYDDNDEKMLADFMQQYSEMFAMAGYENIVTIDTKRKPGNENHEMGGVRMGNDPKTSLLNKWNQLHNCKNVFVTYGACMVSTANQNPSITYMALTARAVDHAVSELKKGAL